MSKLFTSATLRGLTLRNRTVVAPMCQYSSSDGFATDWHLVHLGRFAIGGFGLVILEASAVVPEGRISYADLGIWKDEHVPALTRIVDFLHSQGAAAGIQLAHAGRKASTPVAWRGGFTETEAEKPQVGFESWTPVAPSALIHAEEGNFTPPEALDADGIARVIDGFVAAARRAEQAGFDTVEIHAAHGYLLNQFLSPLANKRTDNYGGSRENRMRLVLEVTAAVRAVWPADKPLLVRISVSDNHPEGWQVEDSVALARELKALGVDAIDASSGGFAGAAIKPVANYQVPFAQGRTRRRRYRHHRCWPHHRPQRRRSHDRPKRCRLRRPGSRRSGRPQLGRPCPPHPGQHRLRPLAQADQPRPRKRQVVGAARFRRRLRQQSFRGSIHGSVPQIIPVKFLKPSNAQRKNTVIGTPLLQCRKSITKSLVHKGERSMDTKAAIIALLSVWGVGAGMTMPATAQETEDATDDVETENPLLNRVWVRVRCR